MATIKELVARVDNGTATDSDRKELANMLTTALEAVEQVSAVADKAGIRIMDSKQRAILSGLAKSVAYHVHLSAYAAHMRSKVLAATTKYLGENKLPQPADWNELAAWVKNPAASKLPADLHSAIREGFAVGDRKGNDQHGRNIK
jgi:hypothetical protein